MRKIMVIAGIAALLSAVFPMLSIAQTESPVLVEFDKDSARLDCMSGKKLPDYTQAERGSFRFYYGRFDKPDDFFWYFFDGRRVQKLGNLALIRKMEKLGTWIIVTKGGDSSVTDRFPRTICEIEHHAVSFIPLNPKTKKPDPRVYVLLDDLHRIQWSDYNGPLEKYSQKKLEDISETAY